MTLALPFVQLPLAERLESSVRTHANFLRKRRRKNDLGTSEDEPSDDRSLLTVQIKIKKKR